MTDGCCTSIRRWDLLSSPRRGTIAAVIAFVASAGVGAISSATVTFPLSIADFASRADVIFAGTVASMRAEYIGTDIVTVITFENTKVVKGAPLRRPVQIRQFGGEIAGKGMVASGAPKFSQGERYILLARESLGSKADHFSPLVGIGHAQFRVVRGTDRSSKALIQDRLGRVLIRVDGKHLVLAARPGESERSRTSSSDSVNIDSVATALGSQRVLKVNGDVAYEVLRQIEAPPSRLTEDEFLLELDRLGAER